MSITLHNVHVLKNNHGREGESCLMNALYFCIKFRQGTDTYMYNNLPLLVLKARDLHVDGSTLCTSIYIYVCLSRHWDGFP